MEEPEYKITQEIGKIYGMIYPYGEYDYNPVTACYAINKELKNLCNQNMRHVLIIILKSLGHKVTPETPTNVICQTIQNDLYNKCFSLNDIDRSKLILAFSGAVGALDSVNKSEKEICYEIPLINRHNFVIDLFARSNNVYGIEEWNNLIIIKLYENNFVTRSLENRYRRIPDYIKNMDSLSLFKKGYDENQKSLTTESLMNLLYVGREEDKAYKLEHVKLIQKVLKRIYDGELPIFVKWSELCDTL